MSFREETQEAISPDAECPSKPRHVPRNSAGHIGRGQHDFRMLVPPDPGEIPYMLYVITQVSIERDDAVPMRVIESKPERLTEAEVRWMVQCKYVVVHSSEIIHYS